MFLPGFLLNFVWESLQSNLYNHHFNDLMDFMMIQVRASLGDVAIIFLIYFSGCYIFNDSNWFAYKTNSGYFILSLQD